RFGVWRSLVAHLLWEQGAGGSNPLTPTTFTTHTTHAKPAAVLDLCSSASVSPPKDARVIFRVGRSRGPGGTGDQGTRGPNEISNGPGGQTSRAAPEWIVRLDGRVASNPRSNGDRRSPAGRCRVLGAIPD